MKIITPPSQHRLRYRSRPINISREFAAFSQHGLKDRSEIEEEEEEESHAKSYRVIDLQIK
jgi:hypothetical protein